MMPLLPKRILSPLILLAFVASLGSGNSELAKIPLHAVEGDLDGTT